MSKNKADQMYHRMLGNTGLQVSILSYGFWATFGVKDSLLEEEGISMAKECLKTARDNGVNLFDNAETYGNPAGEAERIMGEALRQLAEEEPETWRRTDILITTKIFWGGPGINERGLSRKHILEGLSQSLDRLQLDYVDLVFCHRPDPYTPTETVVRAMNDTITSGMATAWGTSEWSAQQITEAYFIARELGLEPPQFEQPQYNMFWRNRFESEYHPLYQAPYNMGTTTWSPLASGLLTGKYNNEVPAGSRLTQKGYEFLNAKLDRWQKDGTIDKVKKLQDFAQGNLSCSVSQLALAWCLKNSNVSTVLLGATKVEQLNENFGSLQVLEKLTSEHMVQIDEILGNKPEPYSGYGGSGMRALNSI